MLISSWGPLKNAVDVEQTIHFTIPGPLSYMLHRRWAEMSACWSLYYPTYFCQVYMAFIIYHFYTYMSFPVIYFVLKKPTRQALQREDSSDQNYSPSFINPKSGCRWRKDYFPWITKSVELDQNWPILDLDQPISVQLLPR